MPLPTDKPHRQNRRRLGRGQYPRLPGITPRLSNAGPVVTILFDRPVFVGGLIDLAVESRTALSQSLAGPAAVQITFDNDVTGQTWALPSPPNNVASPTGAPIYGATGYFGAAMPITANDVLIANGSGGSLGGRGSIAPDGSVSLASGTFTIDLAGHVVAASFSGDGSALTNLPATNPFNQPLNTTDDVTFDDVALPGLASLKSYIINNNGNIAAAFSQLAALQALLAPGAGVTGTVTPVTSISTQDGIVTAVS